MDDARRIELLWKKITGLEAALKHARREALEEAARVAADVRHPDWSAETDDWCAGTAAAAAAIRALAAEPPGTKAEHDKAGG